MTETLLTRCRVVLVRPHYAGNVGSVARLVRNFGLRELVLVDPIADLTEKEARMFAVHGREILESAVIVSTLEEALADCRYVLATSGETGGITRKGFHGSPEAQLPVLLDALSMGPAAIVFGPEPSGLNVAEIAMAHGMIFIPVSDDYASLNLSQAVAICLYELRKQWLKRGDASKLDRDPPASYAEQERLYDHLKESLTDVRFLWDFRSDGIFHVLRQTIARAMPTAKELKVFHGLAKQLRFVAKTWGVPHPHETSHTRLHETHNDED